MAARQPAWASPELRVAPLSPRYRRNYTTTRGTTQIGALNTAKADKIFREVASGRTVKGRPQLERAIDALGIGDILVIAEWDRATRSMMDGINIIQRVADRSATVKVLDKPWLDLTTPMGKGILAFLSALAEDERERITRRANEGRKIAVANGTKFGRKPKLTEHQRRLARERMADGETCRAIARDLGVAHTTISRLR
ncbi:recombinase family protein [Jannaschia helgolandensis]|uniref:Site-specific DNA recombinase n=1 Tax=Jannaschia helgolandensis TaxID=188906 RepID=A0A1H7KJX2_9RHOB|nr:recombinase family protein [Jannaschia helgolandensis]SEK87203.1 Site-specific DNA recombinase [Jannaschia helgolandensis]